MMRIDEPKAEMWFPEDNISHVARCARVCYLSGSKGADSDRRLYDNLVKSRHLSMLRHETHYFHVPASDVDGIMMDALPKSEYVSSAVLPSGDIVMSMNGHYFYEHKPYDFLGYEVDRRAFESVYGTEGMVRHTFHIVTQISTARELNRTSPNNISEMSTRYIRIGGKTEPSIVRPHWMTMEFADAWNEDALSAIKKTRYMERTYLSSVVMSFANYNALLLDDMKPQDARGVLPLDTRTEVVYTYTLDEWRHILDLRLYDRTGTAHPNCKAVMTQVRDILRDMGHDV